MWTPQAAERQIATAFDLAEEGLPHLGRIDDQTPSGEDLNRRVKFLMETCLLLQAASRSVGVSTALRHRALELGRAVAPFARHQRLSNAFLLRPAVTAEYSVAHGCLTLLGLPDPDFQDLVATALAAPVARSFQRLPWKELELHWSERILSSPAPASRARDVLPVTFLARGLDVLDSSRADLYHFTHEIIYATDFGHRPMAYPRPVEELLRDAAGAVLRTLDEDDFDLCAELLLAWPYTKSPWSPAAAIALTALVEIAEQFGVLPSMTFHPGSADDLDRTQRRQYFLRECYHTQYVMAFLMIATLAPGRAPEPGPSATRASSPRACPTSSDAGAGGPLWERLCTPWPAEALADIAVHRAWRRRDFAALGEVLAAQGNLSTRTCEQASDALVRLARGVHGRTA